MECHDARRLTPTDLSIAGGSYRVGAVGEGGAVAQALPLPVQNVKGVLWLVYAPELAAHLRIEERELEAGGVN